MTLQLHHLTVTADVGPDHYEVTSVTDADGHDVRATPEMLDQIEQAIEDRLLTEVYDEACWNCEMPHLEMGRY